MPVVDIKADVRPIGENGGDRTGDTEIQSRRTYGEASTSVPRERVRSESPSRQAEDEGQGQGQRCECQRRILHAVPAVGIKCRREAYRRERWREDEGYREPEWKGVRGAGTSVPRERVRSESPSRHVEDEGPRQGRRCECPRRILHTIPPVGIEADVRPIA